VLGPTQVEDGMPIHTHVEDATPYDSWVRLSEAQQCVCKCNQALLWVLVIMTTQLGD
jgi:hypothetical protein